MVPQENYKHRKGIEEVIIEHREQVRLGELEA